MTECARVILCDPDSTGGGLTATGAGPQQIRSGERCATVPDADGDEGGDGSPRPGPHEVRGSGPREPRGRRLRVGLERRTSVVDPSRVATGGGTARANRAVGVSSASGANRARAARSGQVAA